LRELLATIIKFAAERLDLLVNNLMCSHIATLSERLATDIAAVRTFSCVSPLVCLQVTQLRERLPTSRCFAREWLVTGMGADMDFQMCLLVEALVAVGDGALITLPWLLSSLRCVVLFPC
jgi:hypothetical protein